MFPFKAMHIISVRFLLFFSVYLFALYIRNGCLELIKIDICIYVMNRVELNLVLPVVIEYTTRQLDQVCTIR